MIIHTVNDESTAFKNTSDNFRFAASVAGFAMLLRDSEYKGISSFDEVFRIANASVGKDAEGYRKEFLSLVKKAAELKNDLVKTEDD